MNIQIWIEQCIDLQCTSRRIVDQRSFKLEITLKSIQHRIEAYII